MANIRLTHPLTIVAAACVLRWLALIQTWESIEKNHFQNYFRDLYLPNGFHDNFIPPFPLDSTGNRAEQYQHQTKCLLKVMNLQSILKSDTSV